MSAAKGNKYNQKMTREQVIDRFNDAITMAQDTPFIQTIARNQKTYRDWYTKHSVNHPEWKDDKEICDLYNILSTACEGTLWHQAAKGDVNPSVGIFGLKVNYGYKETSATELSGANGDPIEFNPITFIASDE